MLCFDLALAFLLTLDLSLLRVALAFELLVALQLGLLLRLGLSL